jgi:proteasome lid subunit RPN8/RPN11
LEGAKGMAKRKQPNRLVPELPQTAPTFEAKRIQPQEVRPSVLEIGRAVLDVTLQGLRERSAGRRESGAIWAGDLEGSHAVARQVLFFHELCEDHGEAISLELSEDAKFHLYRDLASRGLKLVGMIHTHPKDGVELSYIDRRNQLCSRIGFWSIVLPWYGSRSWNLTETGVHIRIDKGWFQLSPEEAAKRIAVR